MAYIIDVALAVIIVGMLLVMVFNKNIKEEETFLNKLHMVRVGSDIVNALAEEGTLDTLDYEEIGSRIQEMLPAPYSMQLKLEGTFPTGILVIETNTTSPGQKFIGSGKRIIAIEQANQLYIAEVQYGVWS